MIDPDLENFLTCYLDTLQIIPQQMQSDISCYLQSDLQHQHLMNVSSDCIDNLRRVSCSSEKLVYSKKLVMCLAGIQDICDRRASLITEMYDVLETQARKLMDLQEKMLSGNSQSTTSGTDNHPISMDQDAYFSEDRKSAAHDIDAKNPLDRSELDSKCTQPITLRRNARNPFRARSHLRVVNPPRRAFPAWERGSQSSHNAKSALPMHAQTNRSSKNRCSAESRMAVDKPHSKKPNSFSRYARAQQQRMQNQRRQQQRALCRRTRDVRTRANNSSPIGARLTSKPTLKTHQYLKRAGNLDRKFIRIASSSRSPARRDTDFTGDYFTDDPTTRSASNASSEDETENRDSGFPNKRGSLRGSPWMKSGERSSDEMEDSEHTDDSNVTRTSLQIHEVKGYFGKERRDKPQSPHHGASRSYVTKRRQIVRQHKPSASGSRTPRPTLNRSAVARDKMATDSGSTKLSRFRACPRSTARNLPSAHPSNRRESPIPKKTGTVRTVSNRSPADGRTSDTSTDQSSDERLYCWCRKIAFGDMIACDNKLCKVEWFHFACVGITAQPKGKWYCPLCRGESSKIKRSN